MKIPKEFEDVFCGVELTEDEIRTLNWIAGWESRTVENLRSAIRKAQTTALSTLQAENDQLRSGTHRLQIERDTLLAANQHLREEREQLTAERDDARATLDWFQRHGIKED